MSRRPMGAGGLQLVSGIFLMNIELTLQLSKRGGNILIVKKNSSENYHNQESMCSPRDIFHILFITHMMGCLRLAYLCSLGASSSCHVTKTILQSGSR